MLSESDIQYQSYMFSVFSSFVSQSVSSKGSQVLTLDIHVERDTEAL